MFGPLPLTGRPVTTLPRASVLITDLDDTLYDWLGFWYHPFRSLLDGLVRESGISHDVLESEFRQLHQRYGTSECSFLLQEIPSLRDLHPGEKLTEIYNSTLHHYYSERKSRFVPFPGVLETLYELKLRGCLVIGFTEGLEFYVHERLRRMELDGLLDFLYSPPDHPLPPDFHRFHDDEHYRLKYTEHDYLHSEVLKPNPEVLAGIMSDFALQPEQIVYVGDKLDRDVRMARDAEVRDVYAAYGDGLDRDGYDLLQRVSHWTEADVRREEAVKELGTITPSYELKTSFQELLEIFEFERHFRPSSRNARFRGVDSNQAELALRAWETTVGVQEHFNDLELRIRNLALTVLTAVLGAGAFAYSEELSFGPVSVNVPWWALGVVAAFLFVPLWLFWPSAKHTRVIAVTVGGVTLLVQLVRPLGTVASFDVSFLPVAPFLLLAGLLAWAGFWFMDRMWYHRLLYGAVKHGETIEKEWQSILPELMLGHRISEASPWVSGRLRIKMRSPKKIDLFYLLGGAALAFMAFVFLFLTQHPIPGSGTAP